MKTCTTCGIEKEIANFKNGNRCIQCIKDYKKKHYLENRELYKTRSAANYTDNKEERLIQRKDYRDSNKELLSIKSKTYYTSERGRETNRIRSAKYRSTFDGSIKDTARSLLAYALKMERVVRPDGCSQCLVKCIPEGHHVDYNKPLEVIWLCKSCHEILHHDTTLHTG